MLAIFLQYRKIGLHYIQYGAIAQLVERMNGIHEATGSNPVSSTIFHVRTV
jgi:hypothetical protein